MPYDIDKVKLSNTINHQELIKLFKLRNITHRKFNLNDNKNLLCNKNYLKLF